MKPLNCSSSIGVIILENIHDLQDAINAAKAYESDVLIEKKIIGREFSVGILGEKELPPIEIIPRNGFYDSGKTNIKLAVQQKFVPLI
ncbi:MAG: hypothetical protein ACLTJ5_07735 [Clostridium sp.]